MAISEFWAPHYQPQKSDGQALMKAPSWVKVALELYSIMNQPDVPTGNQTPPTRMLFLQVKWSIEADKHTV